MFAIHHIHYSVEQILRERAKDAVFAGHLSETGFEKILRKVHKKMSVPNYDGLLTLNRLRNSAEHQNTIPAADDVRYSVQIAGDFLRWSYSNYFGVEYDSIAFENMIYDVPTRHCMIKARQLLEAGNLADASKKMHEALGAFKFQAFAYLADARVRDVKFGGIDMPNLLADLGLKLMSADDDTALRLMLSIGSSFVGESGELKVASSYPVPVFASKDEAAERYEDILNTILTYQDRFPNGIWRPK